ncbi:hypothetical protein DPEC_G00011970 [Dallia pectoralis]|uniref:Uncharacterized protein n=1 Tax=Dallia pectoralis TaxID=75939 RepID=A0ACC2HN32_DALPE|nr:hypothetical protein DPEC_G00011970 [Dallia pectoralis]
MSGRSQASGVCLVSLKALTPLPLFSSAITGPTPPLPTPLSQRPPTTADSIYGSQVSFGGMRHFIKVCLAYPAVSLELQEKPQCHLVVVLRYGSQTALEEQDTRPETMHYNC